MITSSVVKKRNRPHSTSNDKDATKIIRDLELCPICESPSQPLFYKKGYLIRGCSVCDHRFAQLPDPQDHVERTYSDEYFMGATAGYFDYQRDEDLLISHGRAYARRLGRFMDPGRLLDVGSAAGFILKGFEETGWSGVGIEPNSNIADFARRQIGVMIETGTLEDTQVHGQFDLVLMIQVIAHFVDPRRALEVAYRLTKPGGYWLIESWNLGSWTARIFGKSWHEYNPPSVLHWMSVEGLEQIVQDVGLSEVAKGRPTKWISMSSAKMIVQRDLSAGPLRNIIAFAAHLVPDGLAIPYILDDVFWALYQKM